MTSLFAPSIGSAKKTTATRRKNTDDRLAKILIQKKKNARPLKNSMNLYMAEYD